MATDEQRDEQTYCMTSAKRLDIKEGKKLVGFEEFQGRDVACREMSAPRASSSAGYKLIVMNVLGLYKPWHTFYDLTKYACCHFAAV